MNKFEKQLEKWNNGVLRGAQAKLAKALGVSRQTISSLETGRYNPSIFLAHKIAQYFDATIEEIFIFEEEE